LRLVNFNKGESDKFILMSSGAPIETPRLHLTPLSLEALGMLRDQNYEGASRAQGFAFSDDFLSSVNDVFLTRQLEGMRKSPLTPGWFVRAILRKDDGLLIGNCGFHGTPQEVGRAEIGYTVFAPYRRRGYAVEAAQGLVDWAKSQGSRVVFAAVSSNNVSSLGVVKKLGFQRTGVQGNDVGAEEYVFELGL
jgi:ribosomal-protein-alanine N-acetyltransferase